MFLEQGIRFRQPFYLYLLGIVWVVLASIVGQLPMIGLVYWFCYREHRTFPVDQHGFMTFFDQNTTLFFLLLPFVFSFFALLWYIKTWHKQPLLAFFTSRPQLDWGRIRFSFALWGLFSVVLTLVEWFFAPHAFVFTFQPLPFFFLCVVGFLFIPIQTTLEELLFRGYLLQGLTSLSRSRWFSLLLTSLLFGLLHLTNPEVSKMGYGLLFYYIGTGLFLGLLTVLDEGMELALGFHAANNLIGALLVTSDWTVFQTPSLLKDLSIPTFGLDVFLPILLLYPILLSIFVKRYRWDRWKSKLFGAVTNI